MAIIDHDPVDGHAHCQAPGCTSTDFCDAHIVPRGFARQLSNKQGGNRVITPQGSEKARRQHGAFDPALLCRSCDRILGKLDGYVIVLSRRFPKTGDLPPHIVLDYNDVDPDRLFRAMLAILWRASKSRRREWADIKLGPWEDRAAGILFNGSDWSTSGFTLVVARYSSPHLDPTKWVYFPKPAQGLGYRAYRWAAGGFRVQMKVDSRPLGSALALFQLRPDCPLRCPIIPLEATEEFAELLQAREADHRKSRG